MSNLIAIYECEDVLVFFLLLKGLVGVELSQIPHQETTTIRSPLSSRKDVIAMDMDGPNLILMTFKRALNFECD